MLILRDPAPDSAELDYVRRAIEQGEIVVVPTDTVYGLASLASDEAAVQRLYALKGRAASQPSAVLYASTVQLRDELPWLSRRAGWAVHALLPGPWTLIVDNPTGHLPWLTGGAPNPLGIRVPAGALDLPPIAATSANLAGEPTIQQVRDLDPGITEQLTCAIDRGRLPAGLDSTVLDLVPWERGTGEIRIVRDLQGRAAQAFASLGDPP